MLAVKTILHPTDFSKEAGYAFDEAWVVARRSGARLVVLHVERPPLTTLGGTAGIPPLPTEYEREEAAQALKRIQPPVIGVFVEHRMERGEPAPVILGVAEEIGADLIVMGTHGRTGFRRLLMGSVAEQVVRKAPCPVLTMKAPPEAGSEIPLLAEEMAPAR
jgi:nucleotide-binding universal stress UspA family protein